MPIPFVGRRMRVEELPAYLAPLTFPGFRPKCVTLHHTGIPDLAQRPTGFSAQHLLNLRDYYGVQLRWSGAPHFFIDDRPDGLIVFQRLDKRGVHAASFNNDSWGVEMLGNYDRDSFKSGRGAAVRDQSMKALAEMCRFLDVPATSIRFHRDDPLTSKSCPGRNVSKADVVARVAALLSQATPPDLDPTVSEWTLRMPGGSFLSPVRVRGGRPIVRARDFLEGLRPGGAYRLSATKTLLTWTPPGAAPVTIDIAELDDLGKSWCRVRDLAEAAGRPLDVQGHKLIVG